jgi:hypothetical protein
MTCFAKPVDGARLLVQAIDAAAVRYAQAVLLSSPQAPRIDPGLGDGLETDASLATGDLEPAPSVLGSQISVLREESGRNGLIADHRDDGDVGIIRSPLRAIA